MICLVNSINEWHLCVAGHSGAAGQCARQLGRDLADAGLVRAAVGCAADFYFDKGLASTVRRYEGVWQRYADLCSRMAVDPLAGNGVQDVTVKYHLACLRQAQICAWMARHRAVTGCRSAERI